MLQFSLVADNLRGEERMSQPPRILVVDDEETQRESLGALLVAEGMVAVLCGKAVEGLQRLHRHEHFDLIISDIVMPDMDGIEFADHVRRLQSALPVVLVTGHDSVIDRVIASGNIALLKPYSPAALKRVVNEQLGRE
jgi:CheY-like chemotaxis protein